MILHYIMILFHSIVFPNYTLGDPTDLFQRKKPIIRMAHPWRSACGAMGQHGAAVLLHGLQQTSGSDLQHRWTRRG